MFRKGEKIKAYGLFEDSSEHDSTALDLGGIGSLLAGIEKKPREYEHHYIHRKQQKRQNLKIK